MTRTRIVRWLRVLLPLIALAILSTLFLLSKEPDEDPTIPYADVDAADMARDPRMTSPDYAGVTADGAAITLRANELRNGDGGQGSADGLRMTLRAADGLAADLTAPDAMIEDGMIRLSGGVRMTTSTGWAVTTPNIDSATDRALIEAPAEVNAFAPFGQLSAGAMQLTRDAPDGDHVLNFTDGVDLIYQP